jgi:hypothetical protein
VKLGIWSDDLRAHVDDCAVCADIVLVAEAMRAQAVADRIDAELPEPGRVWWRARLLAKQESVVRATRPITVWERFASASGLVAVAALMWGYWPTVAASTLETRRAWEFVEGTGLGMIVSSVALASATLLTFLLWFGIDLVRAED